ncbi:DNA mismatch repair protein MutS [Wolbachia endosymbiont of Drosophila malagassya]|uniref:DNA mismatch repair protein MutS n=1 Tax=Wolbachia TaxID=953 RepID=UPI000BAE4B33|nr:MULTISPECIES: DNA mismatch repair protein MutS [Wolbachia]MDU8940939.1 DNA mismatch repair protein MutS [Wolbachia endosymbiont of Drosophila malagassya]MBA8765292.1 DNA mismatch repair protein MutS [Wolbachia pipientis]MDE5066338.1 DNA mismatch repair protein MutS [Wolbachia endosymbiont of Drosophila seguyi]MDU8922171.1 DNA mismatch repair protein MutS [Wolbachia endosymbiont of Scaptomyza pallida]MDU8923175.1 DNA mismatch repair protein MutS [Wolbachia endosymbiont of Drosophila seguyi]
MSFVKEKNTPVMEQYLNLKAQYKDHLLFYRLGDFYELFFDDAIKAAKLLNIVLTKRGNSCGQEIPMCGVPAHSSESYLHKLIDLGFKVAICDQLETADEAKKRGYKSIVKRDVVRVVTPGTIIEDSLLEDKSNNYLASIVEQNDEYAISWLELSTGKFFHTLTSLKALDSDLLRISPRELLISEKFTEDEKIRSILKNYKISITQHAQSFFEYSKSHRTLCEFYKIRELGSIGNFSKVEIMACGALLEYVRVTQRGSIPRLEFPKTYKQQNFMLIDASARRNLELFSTQFGEKKGSLISVIDHTVTASGGRLLKQMLASPLACSKAINLRLSTAQFFVNNHDSRRKIREILSNIPDIERSLSRLILGRGSPKDMNLLKIGLGKTLELSEFLCKIESGENGSLPQQYVIQTEIQPASRAGITVKSDESELSTIHKSLGNHKDLFELLNSAILDNNLSSVKEGGFIHSKYNSELSELSYILNNSNKLVTKLRESYRDLTGIAALKILHNNILGYYVEVSANHKITSDIFIHRQSLANSMRYTTNELKELENKILTARDAAIGLEMKIFSELCSEVAKESEKIALAANALAKLDIRTAFAELAVQNNYVKPIIDDSKEFNICSGRHPVVEVNDKFIANSINLAGIHLITGPNMAGKSTFLRQNALIAILAHMGSFVPAESAHIGVIDKIFSRVGATDNITAGYSTFMVEMIETATIVNQATDRSLVILDEIGRGTGVYDGLSIAQAVIEHIHNVNKCRAIFATHYHELTKVSKYLKNVKCFCVKIREWNGEVIFLHEVIEGIADESYGIHVAKLAGFPDSVLNRASEVFEELKA